MLDLVPLARARREVTDRDGAPDAIRELLELPLPQPEPRTIAPARVSGDEQGRGVSIQGRPMCCHQRRIDRTAKVAVS